MFVVHLQINTFDSWILCSIMYLTALIYYFHKLIFNSTASIRVSIDSVYNILIIKRGTNLLRLSVSQRYIEYKEKTDQLYCFHTFTILCLVYWKIASIYENLNIWFNVFCYSGNSFYSIINKVISIISIKTPIAPKVRGNRKDSLLLSYRVFNFSVCCSVINRSLCLGLF